jgi:glutamine amidotransferase
MQLLTRSSEEGSLPGLGWLAATTVRFQSDPGRPRALKIPHMGWNVVHAQKEGRLFRNMNDTPRFYFVHSYHVVCEDAADVVCTTEYGCPFVSAIEKDNLFGVQFHPEKSHQFGMKLLENFAEIR